MSYHIKSESPKAQLTVVMNTFKRHDMMMDAIDFYSRCPVVKYIYIVWSEKEAVPQSVKDKYKEYVNPQIFFNVHTVDSLNNRFTPLPEPHTEAIFSVDDDMRIPCADLQVAYDVWRGGGGTNMVGWMPRIHIRKRGDGSPGARRARRMNEVLDTVVGSNHNTSSSVVAPTTTTSPAATKTTPELTHASANLSPMQRAVYEYRCWWTVWWYGAYSIILTKASVLSHKYFTMYTQLPAHIHAYVDRRRNCEDILMQFVISNHTHTAPVYVHGHVSDLGVLNGISTANKGYTGAHMLARDECINDLIGMFGHNPLKKSRYSVTSMRSGSAPSTWYEFISSDLWKWG
eukprot:gene28661-34603_t